MRRTPRKCPPQSSPCQSRPSPLAPIRLSSCVCMAPRRLHTWRVEPLRRLAGKHDRRKTVWDELCSPRPSTAPRRRPPWLRRDRTAWATPVRRQAGASKDVAQLGPPPHLETVEATRPPSSRAMPASALYLPGVLCRATFRHCMLARPIRALCCPVDSGQGAVGLHKRGADRKAGGP